MEQIISDVERCRILTYTVQEPGPAGNKRWLTLAYNCHMLCRSIRKVAHACIQLSYGLQVKMALKVRGARDDITVLVVDVLPGPDDRVPPLLRAHAQRGAAAAAAVAAECPECLEVVEPLTTADPSRWLNKLWCACGHFTMLRVRDHQLD